MENTKSYTEKLSRLLYYAIILAVLVLLCCYFSNVIFYPIISAIVAIIGRPVMGLLRKISIKGHRAPDWLLAVLTILMIFLVLGGVLAVVVPLIYKVVGQVSSLADPVALSGLSANLLSVNEFIIDKFSLASDFKLETMLIEQLRSIFGISQFGQIIGSAVSTVASMGIGLFSVVFISFFFIKDETLFPSLVRSLAPSSLKPKVDGTLADVQHLMSRYFVGLIIEMTCVGLIDFLGLWAVARLDFETAIGIGFLAGLLNIIPYLGPLLGGTIGTIMCVIMRYCSGGAMGLDISFWGFVIVLVAIFAVAQLVDNFVLQPLIYSTSIKATPLEVFLVMLIAGKLGGIVGMVAAIPAYTVVRAVIGLIKSR